MVYEDHRTSHSKQMFCRLIVKSDTFKWDSYDLSSYNNIICVRTPFLLYDLLDANLFFKVFWDEYAWGWSLFPILFQVFQGGLIIDNSRIITFFPHPIAADKIAVAVCGSLNDRLNNGLKSPKDQEPITNPSPQTTPEGLSAWPGWQCAVIL